MSKTQRGGVAGGSIKEEQQEQEKEEEEEEEEEEPAMESGKAEDEGGEDGSEGIQGRGRGRERRKGERDVSPVPWDEWTRDVAAILSPGVFVCVCVCARARASCWVAFFVRISVPTISVPIYTQAK